MIDKIQKKVMACKVKVKGYSLVDDGVNGYGFSVPGLVDKNGEQLYTGDIVESKDAAGVIVFGNLNGSLCFYVKKMDGTWRGCYLTHYLAKGELKKIGNIFEEA